MAKLKNSYIDRMMEAKLSSREIDYLLYICALQNGLGTVQGVYYRDVCAAAGISVQKFYDIRDSLAGKGLIRWQKDHYSDITVTLVGNDFCGQEDYEQGYLNVSAKDFASAKFRSLKAGAKLLYLYMQRFLNGKHMSVENFYSSFCRLLGVGRKAVQEYLRQLKANSLLFVSRKRNRAQHYEMTVKNSTAIDRKKEERAAEKKKFYRNLAAMLRRHFRKELSGDGEKDRKVTEDIVRLLDTYKNRGISGRFGIILQAVRDSIELQRREGSSPKLNAALVNRCLGTLFETENLKDRQTEYLF